MTPLPVAIDVRKRSFLEIEAMIKVEIPRIKYMNVSTVVGNKIVPTVVVKLNIIFKIKIIQRRIKATIDFLIENILLITIFTIILFINVIGVLVLVIPIFLRILE